MPNINKPSGLSPVKYLNGADWTGQGNMYYIAAADGNAFNIGDPVTLSGNGDASRGIPGVTIGVAAAAICGVIVAIGTQPDGAFYDPSNLNTIQAPATKTKPYYVLVVDDPQVVFEIQEGGGGAALTSADISQNGNFLAAAPTGITPVSGYTLNNATLAATSTLNLKLLGLVRRADNAFGQYAKWLVKINNHQFGSVGTAGV